MSTETLTPSTKSAPAEAAPAKRSAFEGVKEASRQLRGTIALELANDTDHFNEQNKNLLKFHGSYQQEDRDARKSRRKEGVGKHYMFMVRCKIPGGKVTPAQYLAMDQIAGTYANSTLRITTRQGIQFHGVLMDHLKDTIKDINDCLLTTLGACGDVERNVMACPAPHHDGVHAQLQETAAILAAHLAPRTRAYHDIWLNGKLITEQPPEADIEPLYGKVYLPRKFKTGLALPEDNCIDIYAQDLGLLAIVENGTIVGYNVLVGGGMGMSHGNANTFPHLARPICYVPARSVVGAAEAVVKLFRDHGNRADRKRARIKYVVHDWGVEKFRQVLSEYVGGALLEPRPVEVAGFDPHLGWHPQGHGKFYYGLSIENGRIKDEGSLRLRSGLRTLIERFQPNIRFTPLQDIILGDLDSSARPDLERTLAEFGIRRPDEISTVQKFSMACPAIPTCGLALSESERALPDIIDQLEVELKRLGLENEKLTVRMTGCPNGCARPYQSDIGIVGRSGDKYTLFVGGNLIGSRLNFTLRDLVPLADLVPTLVPLLENFKRHRQAGEGFGDYCQRLGADKLMALIPEVSGKPAKPHSGEVEPTLNGDSHPGEGKSTNGNHSASTVGARVDTKTAALAQPQTQVVPLAIPQPNVVQAPVGTAARKRSETFLAGPAGEELPDYTMRYHSDGTVRETVVLFYGEDVRAANAAPGQPLRREAVYQGLVNPVRLHGARKLSDTYYVGGAGEELRDRRVEYHRDGTVAQTVIFQYDGEARASDVPSGARLNRQVVYEGTAN